MVVSFVLLIFQDDFKRKTNRSKSRFKMLNMTAFYKVFSIFTENVNILLDHWEPQYKYMNILCT